MAITCEEARKGLRNALVSNEERKRRGIGLKQFAREYAAGMRHVHVSGEDGSPPCEACGAFLLKLQVGRRVEFDTT